jgi:hypothetical protein
MDDGREAEKDESVHGVAKSQERSTNALGVVRVGAGR